MYCLHGTENIGLYIYTVLDWSITTYHLSIQYALASRVSQIYWIRDFTCAMQFKKVFSAFKDVKVIQFSSMQDAFLGFTDKASHSISFFFPSSSIYFSSFISIITYLNCLQLNLFRLEKIDSGIVWSGMLAYGVVCKITLQVTYIMTCTGMRNLVGNRSHLKPHRMITHPGEYPDQQRRYLQKMMTRVCLLSSKVAANQPRGLYTYNCTWEEDVSSPIEDVILI